VGLYLGHKRCLRTTTWSPRLYGGSSYQSIQCNGWFGTNQKIPRHSGTSGVPVLSGHPVYFRNVPDPDLVGTPRFCTLCA
jgi:hypothetical protein